MAICHFFQYEQELFYRYWDRSHAYLIQCDSYEYLYGKWDILMKHGIFLIGWLRILMNLRLVVLIPTTHSLASPIWPLLGVKLATILIMIAHLVPFIFLMRFFLDLAV